MTFFLSHIVLNLIFSVCIISTSITVYEVGWVLILYTSPGQIMARFYSLIFDKKKLTGAGFYLCKGRALFYTQPYNYVKIIINNNKFILLDYRLFPNSSNIRIESANKVFFLIITLNYATLF